MDGKQQNVHAHETRIFKFATWRRQQQQKVNQKGVKGLRLGPSAHPHAHTQSEHSALFTGSFFVVIHLDPLIETLSQLVAASVSIKHNNKRQESAHIFTRDIFNVMEMFNYTSSAFVIIFSE